MGSGLFKPANFSRLTMRLVTGARTASGLNRHTRQNYMNLARTFGGELFNTIDLMSDTALYLLARPGTPENIQNYFIQKAKDGENIKVKDIQDAKSKV